MAPHVLIVEDDPSVRSLLYELMKQEGFSTTQTPDGAAAIEAARKSKPDLVLLDMMLPVRSGEEVIRSFWGDQATVGIPIVIVTAKFEEVDVYRQLIGEDRVFIKPFEPEDLVSKVKELVV